VFLSGVPFAAVFSPNVDEVHLQGGKKRGIHDFSVISSFRVLLLSKHGFFAREESSK
jgi:hypothetical protein